MTPTEIAALAETGTFYLPLTLARGAALDVQILLEGLPLDGASLRAKVTDYRNGALVASMTATVESFTTPTFAEMIAANPEFILPEGALETDTARLANVRLQVAAADSAEIPEARAVTGGDVKLVWDCYADITGNPRIWAGEFILSEGSSYA